MPAVLGVVNCVTLFCVTFFSLCTKKTAGKTSQTCTKSISLRSKRFRLVSEQRKNEERDSRFWPREKCNKSQKMKVGGGGGEGRKEGFLPFFPTPSPLLLTPFFPPSTLVPRVCS